MCDDELNRILNEEISVLNPHPLPACEMKYWREFRGVVLWSTQKSLRLLLVTVLCDLDQTTQFSWEQNCVFSRLSVAADILQRDTPTCYGIKKGVLLN